MTAPDRTPAPVEHHGRPRLGPVVMLVPLLSLVLGVLWARQWRPHSSGEFPRPPESQPTEGVRAWAAARTLAGGGRLVARLAPLHADPERQAFDAESLQRRLRLPAGEPWRLALALEQTAGTVPIRERALALDLSHLTVVDADGTRLVPIEAASVAPGPGEVADPVAVLMAPPRGELTVGKGVHFVLWGSAPSASVTITGLVPDEPLALQQDFVARETLEASIARLDRAASATEEEQR